MILFLIRQNVPCFARGLRPLRPGFPRDSSSGQRFDSKTPALRDLCERHALSCGSAALGYPGKFCEESASDDGKT